MTDQQPFKPSIAVPGGSGGESVAPMGQRVAKGAIWTMAANAARISSAILILPILTRVLSPEDFGLIQIATPFLFFLMVFSDLGMQPALVVAENPSDKLWSTAFWTGLGAATMLMLLLMLTAPLIADFYNEPRAERIIQALSVIMVIGGSMIVPGAWLLRTMSFRTLAIVEFTTVTIGIVAALTGALMGLGVWSLVLQQLVMYSLKAIALCTASKAPLRFEYAVSELRTIMRVGWGMTNVRIVTFFTRNIDILIIGRFLGATILGYYSIAWRIMMMPIEIFAGGLIQVLLPSLGQIKTETGRLKAALFKTYRTISLFTFPAMAGIAALSVPLTYVIFGEKFAPAAYPIAALAIHGALQSLLLVQSPVYMALGRIDIMYRWSLISLFTLATCLLIGVQWGLQGASLGYLISSLICAPLNFRAMLKLIGADLGEAWMALRVQGVLALTMGFVVFSLTMLVPDHWPKLYTLFLGIPLGVVIYVGGLTFFDRKAISDVLDIVRSIFAKAAR